MSEIKGQLLGIVLLLTVFAAISGIITVAVTALSNKVEAEITQTVGEENMPSKTTYYISKNYEIIYND